jgi:hypothetical protein
MFYGTLKDLKFDLWMWKWKGEDELTRIMRNKGGKCSNLINNY